MHEFIVVLTLHQGDTFNLNVVDKLTDHTMLRQTSIVRDLHIYIYPIEPANTAPLSISIGTVSSRKAPTIRMDLLVSRNGT